MERKKALENGLFVIGIIVLIFGIMEGSIMIIAGSFIFDILAIAIRYMG